MVGEVEKAQEVLEQRIIGIFFRLEDEALRTFRSAES